MKNQLTSEERHFFSLVRDASLANPFSKDRNDADLKISGLFNGTPKAVILEKTIEEVRKWLESLKLDGRADLRKYKDPDKTILKAAFLFDFFHTYHHQFDTLIEEMVGNASNINNQKVKVPFARKAISELWEKGFDHGEAVHFLSMCFQLRRAYFFINKNLVGESQCMTRFREVLWNNVFTSDLAFYTQELWNKMEDFSTLIIGETGSGKGTAANAIGRSGYIPFNEKEMCFEENFTRSFVELNISQFPKNLIESELFGHQKGSFTGAVDDHKGVFARCSPYGAIFLDEIGEVSVPIQIKLLKVLEERAFSPVGSRKVHRFKGRIITATNRSFAELKNPAILRKDLYYRLCSDIIVVPPLWQRIRENPKELDHLLENRVTHMIGSVKTETIAMLRRTLNEKLGRHYVWPGNVRELEQYVRRILLNRKGNVIHEFENLATSAPDAALTSLAAPISRGEIKAQDLVRAYCYELFQKFNVIGEVARRTGLDRRTVKKYCDEWAEKTD